MYNQTTGKKPKNWEKPVGLQPKTWEKTIFKPKEGQVQGVTAWRVVLTMWLQRQKQEVPIQGQTTWSVVQDRNIVFGKADDP